MLKLGKYSFGVGDRFAHQAKAQLQACMLAAEQGVEIVPVWNKSNREHTTIGSEPASVRAAADAAVQRPRLDEALPCGRRPHPAGNGGRLPRRQRLLHASTWPTPSASPPTPAPSRRLPTGTPNWRGV